MDTLQFRQATGVDAEKVAALHTESWRDAYRTIMPDWYLDGPISKERANLWRLRLSASDSARQYVLLAESSWKLVGFVCVLLDEEPQWGACLDNLHVLPGLRGKGIGRRLLAGAVKWVMSAEPVFPIHLWVFEANSVARCFYDAIGGEIVDYKSKEVLKRIEIPSVLYIWKDLRQLLINLT